MPPAKNRRLVLAAFGLAALPSSAAYACRFKSRSFEQQLAAASTVFIGTVLRSSNGRSGREAIIPAAFSVLQSMKGTAREGELVEVSTSSSSCGLAFQANETWLVLATGKLLESNAPSGSALLKTDKGIETEHLARIHALGYGMPLSGK